MTNSQSASEVLAGWALELHSEDVPASVRSEAVRHILDAVGCGLAARRLGEAAAAVNVAKGLGTGDEATILDGTRTGAASAALANGALMHALDFDDTHTVSLIHATVAVLPAALAVAEEVGCSGFELVTAFVAGVEVVTRLGRVAPHRFHARGFHPTSVCGTFASALVASRLYRLDVDQTVNAIGIAGSLTAGSMEFLADGSSTKHLHPGWAGHAGVIAARLAANGATGPRTILEGDSGLYRAYIGSGLDIGALTWDLGSTWETKAVTIKPYPACQLSHAALDALGALGATAEVAAAVHFTLPEDAASIVCRPEEIKHSPRSAYDAKFSLQWCAAALLVDGSLTVDTFRPESINRPRVLALAHQISFETFDPGRPAAAAGASVELRTADGRALTAEVSESRGGATHPLDDAEVRRKFLSNAGAGHEEIAEDLLGLESLGSVARLTAHLARGAG